MATEKKPDVEPAYALWVQLATRVTTQKLHYRAGEEETAARSIYSLFEKTRSLLEAHRKATAFRAVGLELLNVTLRPYTARWHGWMVESTTKAGLPGKEMVFRDELVRRLFRTELEQLRKKLLVSRTRLAGLAEVSDDYAEPKLPTAEIGTRLAAGIGTQVDFHPHSTAGVEEINRAEHEEILARRSILQGKSKSEWPLLDASGIALSGGGIRSATFCLGILQVLVKRRMFAEFDYLSTVSGGGYLGAFLSCALGSGTPPATSQPVLRAEEKSVRAQKARERLEDAFLRQKSGTESGLLRHLRNESKFLLNGGLIGRLRMFGLVLSGIVWNFLIAIPVPLLAAGLVSLLAAKLSFWGDALPIPTSLWPRLDSLADKIFAGLGAASAAALFGLPVVQWLAHGKRRGTAWVKFSRGYSTAAVLVGVATVVALFVTLQPLMFWGYEAMRRGLSSRRFFSEVASTWLAPAGAGVGSVILGTIAAGLKERWPRVKNLAARLFILSGPLFFVLLYLGIGNWLGLGRPAHDQAAESHAYFVLGAAVFLVVWNLLWVNINTLSPHGYYRARLCECYLVRRPPAGEPLPAVKRSEWRKFMTGEFTQGRMEALQQVPLSHLGQCEAAPYHLINATVNLPASNNKELRGRAGDFFLISKHFCGAPVLGYQSTATVVEKDPHLDLGTAMAISAAAASSSMGWKSLPHLRFVMTLLNVRLGYWLRWRGMTTTPGFWYLFREMAARVHEHSRFVNLSDGGHIENLGAYELLRRRCKFILCVDGGHEPGMECADLARLQRYAEIDLGISFEYGIADLSVQPNGFSRAPAILVKIVYARDQKSEPTELGWMLYLKLALTGIEPNYVMDFRRENPEFPHHSTADQLYDEAQFEAYRRLGESSAESMFRAELFSEGDPTSIESWFQGLANKLIADNDPVFKDPGDAIKAAIKGKEEESAPAPAAS